VLPEEPGQVVVQGEDLGQWAGVQRRGWDRLGAAQQWLLKEALRLGPVNAGDREREGHLEVPHRHVEKVGGDEYALGVFVTNSRSRQDRLAPERVEELSALGMRWG
jgi:hypothetical protein